ALTPSKQLSWTNNHVPMKPAKQTLHEMMAERKRQQEKA
ncbi:lactate utilisation protein LutB domain-containing protein, partial [Neisseria sp.]